MAKKELVRLEEGARTTTAAFACAELLDAALLEQLGPATADEAALASGGGMALRIGRRLATLSQRFQAARELLERVRDENRRWRRRRDRAFDRLYDLVKAARGLCREHYGKRQADEFLGLRGALPRVPRDLHHAAGPVRNRLLDDEWPQPRRRSAIAGLTVDRRELGKDFANRYRELGTALDALEAGDAREVIALAAKERAKEAFKTFEVTSVRFLEAGLELAGLDDLAAILRPGVGRMGRPAKALPATGGGKVLAGGAAKALPADAADEDGAETPESSAEPR